MGNQTLQSGQVVKLRPVMTIGENARVTQAAQIMQAKNIGCLVVVNERQAMAGLITERDVLRYLGTATPATFGQRVVDIMTATPVTCSPDTPLAEVQRLMARHNIRHLPVVEAGRPVGMISARDVLKASVEKAEDAA